MAAVNREMLRVVAKLLPRAVHELRFIVSCVTTKEGDKMNGVDFKRALLNLAIRRFAQTNNTADLTVDQAMTPSPTCVPPDCSALELVEMFHDKQFRHLLVHQGKSLVGTISDRDLLLCFGLNASTSKEELRAVKARQLMSTDLITVSPTTSLIYGLGLMVEHGISCLPVVTGSTAVGILTSTDLLLVLEQLLDFAAVADHTDAFELARRVIERR
jgi:acetoin utilization protein AcuB